MVTKQVLIWRTDLRNTQGHKVRTGKIAAQLAHASMKAILDEGEFDDFDWGNGDVQPVFTINLSEAMHAWLSGLFTKVCVSTDSEAELLLIYDQAKKAGLHCSLIQDAGLTEFDGVPTYTAVAVGPGPVEEIDKITGHLKLL